MLYFPVNYFFVADRPQGYFADLAGRRAEKKFLILLQI
jgi:hypothetical protein